MLTVCLIASCTVGVGNILSMFDMSSATINNMTSMIIINIKSPFSMECFLSVLFLSFMHKVLYKAGKY